MSLLDDVSIVVTPNGYKAGELYAVVPVPTEGAEEVTSWTNNDFSSFVSSGSNITQMVSSGSGNNCYSLATITSGKLYKLKFTSSQAITCQIRVSANTSLTGATVVLSTLALGLNEIYFTTPSDYTHIGFYAPNAFTDTQISGFTLKEYTSADMDVTRATDATRVNESGLIEDVLANVPRIDYTGGGCPHILAEPQRTNLVTYSEDFTDSSWLKTSGGAGSNPIVTSSYATSPEGLVNASRIQFECGGVTSGDYSRLYSGLSLNGSSQYSQSFYIKSNTGSSQNLLFYTQNNDGDSITATTEWVRVDVQFTSNTANFRNFGLIAKGSIQQTVDVSIYGAQLEEGSYATSYIPTSGSTVTRNQDIFTRDGIGSLIGQTEGTFFIELSKPVLNPDTYYLISLNNAAADTNANSVTIGFDSSSADFYIRLESGGSTIYVDNNRASLANTFYKIAVAYKSGQSLIYIDGSPITPNSGSLSGAFSFSETLDNLSFDYDGNNSLPFFGKVKQLQVYDTALTDEQLTSLTT